MKSTERFKEVIEQYLTQRAAADRLFAVVYNKPHKNLDDCVTYILNAVKASGCNGFEDSEIFSLATHYYDEETITVGSPIDCKVVVNHTVELTEEEKAQARKDAIRRVHEEAYAKLTQAKTRRLRNSLKFNKPPYSDSYETTH